MPALPSTLARWFVASVTLLGCSSAPSNFADDGDPGDGSGSGATDGDVGDSLEDGGVDAPDAADASMIDAPAAGSLAQMCGSTPTTPAEWEQCYVKRWCETTVHCAIANVFASVQECITASNWSTGTQRDFDASENIRSVNDGRASIDVTQFTNCLSELSTNRCNTAGTAPACKLRYQGTIANGGSCYANADCAGPDALCSPVDCGASCCTGVCTPKKALGSPTCSGAGVNACEPGLVCSSQGCVSGDVGSVCTSNSGCDAAGYCSQIGTQPGVCALDKDANLTCSNVLQCGGETGCVGLIRNVGTPMCRRISQPGDACDDYCLGAMYCDLPASGLGVCKALPSGDQTCVRSCRAWASTTNAVRTGTATLGSRTARAARIRTWSATSARSAPASWALRHQHVACSSPMAKPDARKIINAAPISVVGVLQVPANVWLGH